MAKIVKKEILAEKIKRIEVLAPEIAQKTMPGQFVVLRIDEKGERIPLTIAEKNLKEGTISLIFQEIGATTKRLGSLDEGGEILNLAGPLGKPSEIKNYGKVIAIGGGVGTAVVY
ncbi:sulfide/dihydroorotate dehydrogenase-like FAD/NAD-binding protein, partial [bacterium]|nr:sulfide/dihydroorotate dehydrogenase-like FAD/NAD-binding protein [bacterium]